MATHHSYASTSIESLIARDLWGMSECYQILNESNPIVLKAIELAK